MYNTGITTTPKKIREGRILEGMTYSSLVYIGKMYDVGYESVLT